MKEEEDEAMRDGDKEKKSEVTGTRTGREEGLYCPNLVAKDVAGERVLSVVVKDVAEVGRFKEVEGTGVVAMLIGVEWVDNGERLTAETGIIVAEGV